MQNIVDTIRGLAVMLDNGSGVLTPQKEKMEGANATLKCHFRDFMEFLND
jgi:hypothetical protein